MPDKEITVGHGHVIKAADQSLFGGLVKIDHDISAEDQVEWPAKLDRIHQIEGPKDHIVSNLRSDRKRTVWPFGKIFALPGGGKL